ncbi:AAA family ATPase [Amycolatopsis nalaikhensis]|uniref:Tetratricopeptide repeat protein n=2 Tax=Amycolatopsis TaxID=1813 RepID=A0ABY8XJJ7_9PSEU|nr:AAA family ATPase [Amycolatopsis sp. 2-2]WIV55800.1 hypothetical protein QP939_44510 [Amycolatopsis sp. 2-2]
MSLGDQPGRSAAVVRWWRLDDTVDAALLEVPADDETWVPPASLRVHPQRWGRFVTAGTELAVAAMGFPRQQRRDGLRHPEVLGGRVRPHGGATFEILDAHGTMDFDTSGLGTESRTPWSGMSGAAVFPDGDKLLLGVVRSDRRPEHGTRLLCTTVESLLALADFRAVVRAASGVDPGPEPAELAGLLEPAPPKRALTSPTMLLRADAEVVPFHGREDTLSALERWCSADTPGPAVRVLTGPGGQGKTRLARELMARLRERGWVAGQVHGREVGDVRALRAIQHPVLFVVDYAETRPELVRELAERAEDAPHPVRLLLLARGLGSWQFAATGRGLDELKLPALSPGATDRESAFRAAARGLAPRLGEVTGRTDVDWRALAETVPARVGAAGAETALTTQMAALVALLRHGRDPEGDQPLEGELLAHERRYWLDNAAARDLGKRAARLLEPAVAAAVLCPALDEVEAGDVIRRALPAEPGSTTAEIAELLREPHPPPEGRYWGQLEPDRLAEYQASEAVIADPKLLERLFADAPDHLRGQTLTVLARAAVAHANERRTRAAQTVVERLRAALRSASAERPLTAATLRTHLAALPEQTHVLRDYALDVARELSGKYPATSDDPDVLRDRAWALHSLAERYLGVGDWDHAHEAASEAVAIRERLADDGALAESLLVASEALRVTGNPAEAHRAGAEALRLFRTLAADEGPGAEKRERGLVRALVNLSVVVWQLDPTTIDFDQVARSEQHADEAVRRARVLAEQHPELDPLLLVRALEERSNSLWRLQKHPESFSQSEEVVETARRLAHENPDAGAADLANALLGMSVSHSAADRPYEERKAAELEAIAVLRPLADELPEVHRPVLALLLHNLACEQRDEGDHAAARESVTEAIRLRRAVTYDPRGDPRLRLAQSLWVLGHIDYRVGDDEAAMTRYREALALYDEVASPLNTRDLNTQAEIYRDLAAAAEALGRKKDALDAQNRAIATLRRLSDYAPSLYAWRYVSALHDQSDLYQRHDRPVAARTRLRQVLPRYRRLARDTPEARSSLAWCLYDLGTSYASAFPTVPRAVAPLREAYELRTALAAEDASETVHLATTCAALSRALTMTSLFAEAARVAEHEVRVRRGLLDTDREGQELSLCFALLRLAEARTMAGAPDEAWRTAVEAEELCLAVAANATSLTKGRVLRRLARALSLCGRHDWRRAARAEEPARRAVRVYRNLVDRHPGDAGLQADLREAVRVCAQALDRLGRHSEAVDVQQRRGA